MINGSSLSDIYNFDDVSVVEEVGCLQSSGFIWENRAVAAAASSETLDVKHLWGIRSASSSLATLRTSSKKVEEADRFL